MLENRVRDDYIGQYVAILDHIDQVQCKVVVDDEDLVDGFLDFRLAVIVARCTSHDCVFLARATTLETQLEVAVGIGFADGASR